MNDVSRENLEDYYASAESWSDERSDAERRMRRIAWIVAGVAAAIALLEAIALVVLVPLKRDVPYTILVDRETGYVQAVNPLSSEHLTADTALTRSFLVQYVVARESFDRDMIQTNYRKVGLWSAADARERYVASMRSGAKEGDIAGLPRGASIDVDIRSVSSIAPDTAMVRFSTTRTDPGGRQQVSQNWVATIRFRYTDAKMSAADRFINPLGFQVTRYRRDAETLPDEKDEPASASDNADEGK